MLGLAFLGYLFYSLLVDIGAIILGIISIVLAIWCAVSDNSR
jgi:hypothetical protein